MGILSFHSKLAHASKLKVQQFLRRFQQ